MMPRLCAHCGRLFESTANGRVYRLERIQLPIEEMIGFGNKVVKRWCSLECFVSDSERSLKDTRSTCVIDNEAKMGDKKKVSPRTDKVPGSGSLQG